MKRATIVALLLILVSLQNTSLAEIDPDPEPALDTTIQVVIVADPRIAATDVALAIDRLVDSWNNTQLSTTVPTAIEIVPNGLALPAPESVFSGTGQSQIDKLRIFVEAPLIPTVLGIRDTLVADIVIGLSSDISDLCGEAPQPNWIGVNTSFVEALDGLDRREANRSYIAVAQVFGASGFCGAWPAAHEFGHLLGAGHYDTVIPGISLGLLSDSKAYHTVVRNRDWVSASAQGPGTPACPRAGAAHCRHLKQYSDLFFGNPSHRNYNTLNKTARSVANYRVSGDDIVPPDMCIDGIDNDGDGNTDSADPQCITGTTETAPPPPPPPVCNSTVPPDSLTGWLEQVCVPGTTSSEYAAQWHHPCPASVTHYDIFKSQPVTAQPIYGWTVFAPFTGIEVFGVPGTVQVRACGFAGCSAPTSTSFLVVDLC